MTNYCKGCLKPGVEKYCLPCRKKLFDGQGVSPVLPFPAPSKDLRPYQENTNKISISGVQIKYALRLELKKLRLTDMGGQYILKPEPKGNFLNLDQAAANEHVTMQIAAQVFKIRTAANAMVFFETLEGEPAYLTRRFDVLPGGLKNQQEDFAQLAGRTEDNAGRNYKYSASYEDIALLMKKYVAAYKPEIEHFFKLVVFNYLFSNGDAHLKNFSLVQTTDGDYVLSPAYDLMNTAIHTPGERDLAFEDGLFDGDYECPGFEKYGCYTYDEFLEFAQRIGVLPQQAEKMLGNLLGHEEEVESLVTRSFLNPQMQAEYLRMYHQKKKQLSTRSV